MPHTTKNMQTDEHLDYETQTADSGRWKESPLKLRQMQNLDSPSWVTQQFLNSLFAEKVTRKFVLQRHAYGFLASNKKSLELSDLM